MKFLIQWPSENGTNHTRVDQLYLPRCGDKIAVTLQGGGNRVDHRSVGQFLP
jgi:hypothetical protein